MGNILTAAEAANVLRTSTVDAVMLQLLPLVDSYLKMATGHDWAADANIRVEAKSAAQMLLVMWYENPSMTVSGTSLNFGLQSAIVQLQAIALGFRELLGRNGAGAIVLAGVHKGDSITSVTGIIGVSGDQSAAFESVISVDGYIQQLSASDLSGKWYRIYVQTPGEL